MKRAPAKRAGKAVQSRGGSRAQLERWRRDGANLQVELRRPRAIDVVPIDFLRGEPTEGVNPAKRKFRGRLIYFTSADVTIRRPSGAILVIDNYEIATLSDGKVSVQLR